MKRIALFATLAIAAIAGMGAFASISSAVPVSTGGGGAAAVRAAEKIPTTKYAFTVFYEAAEYYGPVVCGGEHIVSTKYPAGRDVESCDAEPVRNNAKLVHMIPGPGQTEFENATGGFVGEWESDCPCAPGLRTTDFTYKVAPNLRSFKIVAIY